ncbi:hypothetical protein PoB_000384700 [Plakobranchus ocellatus]|uniref:Uncharacterized protein n=1 Tax=Plakobranchus ocellatus TaxID=259542 RepID=A0AAV3Y3P1_9GAST|nr:hypothetical protein PoB_000384700 [Plakobranchus ocellatus]
MEHVMVCDGWLEADAVTPLAKFLIIPLYFSGPQHGDLRLSGPTSGQSAGGGAQTCDRGVSADLRADSLSTVPPTPQTYWSLISIALTNDIQY